MRIKKALLVSFNGTSNAGGVERVAYYLDTYFQSRNIPTKIITEDFLLNHTLFGRLLPFLFRFRHFQKRRPIYLSRYASAYLWWARRPNQMVVTQGESSAYYPVDAMIQHGSYHEMELAYGRKETSLSRYGKLQQKACESARLVLAVSEKVKADTIRWYHTAPEKIKVLANCVDTNIFYPRPRSASGKRTLLFVGRPVKEKGLPMLQQIAKAMEKQEGWRLLVVTNQPLDKDYFEGSTKTTVVAGLTIDNICREAYAKADLLIIPSIFEGFEMVTLEALAAGIPVIGTPVGAVKALSDMGFPGAYQLPDLPPDSTELLQHFDSLLDSFHASITPGELHELVKEQFGVEAYFRKLDQLLLKQTDSI